MREIKFRFYYGIDGETETYFHQDFTLAEIMNGYPFEVTSDNPLMKHYSCIGQGEYTGLKDKNGKEIYEGDILNVDDGMRTVKVVWHKYCAAFDTNFISAKSYREPFKDLHNSYWRYRAEVIGNIYENPELLEAR